MKAPTVVGVVMLLAVVAVVLVTSGSHAAAGPTPSPTPSVLTSPLPSGSATPHSAQPSTWDQATGSMAHVTLLAWLLALSILPLFALAGIALHARHRARLVELDHPPLRRPEFVHRAFDVKALEARRGWLPESFTYSPHMRNDVADLVEDEEPQAPLGELLTVQQALELPGIVYGQRLDTGEPLVEQRVLSLAIGGRPGSGKTSTVVLLAAQYVRMGALVYVADPHSGHPDSLLTRLEPLMGRPQGDWRVAETPRETLLLVGEVHAQLERRKAGWRRHNGDQRPLVAILDEFAESLRLLPPHDRERLLDLVQVIGYSGRKYNTATILLSQSWLVGAIGTSGVRNPLRAAIAHAMRADEGRALTGLRAEAWPADPQELPPGEAYALGIGGSGLIRVRVPLVESALTTARARVFAANSLSGSEAVRRPFVAGSPVLPEALSEPVTNGSRAGNERLGEPVQLPEELPEHRVRELLEQGYDIGRVIRELAGIKRGDQYRQLHLQVQRWLVRRMR